MTLQSTWFFVWGLLWAVFFITDGFDLGIGTLYPFLGKSENDKRVMINAMGPLWDGNQVWLLTAGGVTFAAFPTLYAVMFSSLYSALMLILFALIIRGVAFEFRKKMPSTGGRRLWLRATGSTAVSQLIDSVIIIGIAFWLPGRLTLFEFLNVAASNYSSKLIIAIFVGFPTRLSTCLAVRIRRLRKPLTS